VVTSGAWFPDEGDADGGGGEELLLRDDVVRVPPTSRGTRQEVVRPTLPQVEAHRVGGRRVAARQPATTGRRRRETTD